MITAMVLAASLYLCPGGVYTDEPREGCHVVESSGQEGFSRTPDVQPDSLGSGASQPGGTVEQGRTTNQSPPSELCTLYHEYVQLDLKTQGGFVNKSPEEADRWQTLRRVFQATSPPSCP